jgi:hypothetical protein
MEARAAIETVLDKLYDARRRNDPTAAADCFHENGRFRPNGAPESGAIRISWISLSFVTGRPHR